MLTTLYTYICKNIRTGYNVIKIHSSEELPIMKPSPDVHAGLQDRNAAETSYLDWTCVNMTPNDLKMPPTVIMFVNNPPTTKNVLELNCDIMVVVNCRYVKLCEIFSN